MATALVVEDAAAVDMAAAGPIVGGVTMLQCNSLQAHVEGSSRIDGIVKVVNEVFVVVK